MVTFTASVHDELPLNPPRPVYLSLMAVGLAESHGLDADAITAYLLARPGCTPAWTRDELTALVTSTLETSGP